MFLGPLLLERFFYQCPIFHEVRVLYHVYYKWPRHRNWFLPSVKIQQVEFSHLGGFDRTETGMFSCFKMICCYFYQWKSQSFFTLRTAPKVPKRNQHCFYLLLGYGFFPQARLWWNRKATPFRSRFSTRLLIKSKWIRRQLNNLAWKFCFAAQFSASNLHLILARLNSFWIEATST